MLASGTADGHNQLVLSFLLIIGQQHFQEIYQLVLKQTGLLMIIHIIPDWGIQAAHRAKRRIVKRIWQKANIEHQIGIQRDAVFKPKRNDDRQDGIALMLIGKWFWQMT